MSKTQLLAVAPYESNSCLKKAKFAARYTNGDFIAAGCTRRTPPFVCLARFRHSFDEIMHQLD
jgi:hypothetical protein